MFKKLLDRIIDFGSYEYEFLLKKDADMPRKIDYEKYYDGEEEYRKDLYRHYFWRYYYRFTHLPLYLPYLVWCFYIRIVVFIEQHILKKDIEF
jgi:hypothetical protein